MTSLAYLLLPDGSRFDLRGTSTLGRSASNTLRFSGDERIGRRHALLQCQSQGEYWVVDLGSRNGTFLNGRRVSRPMPLKHGDELDMAGTRLVFHTDHTAAATQFTTQGPTLPIISRQHCWLMVADIANCTRMTLELPPEDIPQITGGWFNTCRELVEEHGGQMNQYTGDGYFCYWDESVEAAGRVLAALRALALLQEQHAPDFRVVLHYGETVFSGVPLTGDQNLHGQEVHFVFRMEKIAAKFGQRLLCSGPALAALGVPSLTVHESEVAGYKGVFPFHVPDLA
jgi:adenylate cyclase